MDGWILISGAGSGIGRAIAVNLAELGFRLLLLGRSRDKLEETRRGLHQSEAHRLAPCDVRDAAALRGSLDQAQIDALSAIVACAGIGGENQYGREDRWRDIIETNLSGTYYLVNEGLDLLRAERNANDFRHIVIISSILARLGVPGYSAYCASKAGLLGLMRSWAQAWASERILVNAICPGWVNTAMARQGLETFARHDGKTYEQSLAEQMAHVPLGKMSEPDEIAALVRLLVAGEQTSITGQVLDINNGAIMPS